MRWYEIAFSLTDPHDYIEFATKCRDLDVKQEFRPSAYRQIIGEMSGFVEQGLSTTEAFGMFRKNASEPSEDPVTINCCGGGKVL